jgi:hypothetical protein
MNNYGVFDSTPTTYLLPANLDDSEFHEFNVRYYELATGYSLKENIPTKHCQ